MVKSDNMKKLLFSILLFAIVILIPSCSDKPLDNDTYVLFNDITVEGKDGWLFYSGDESIEIYKGINYFSKSTMASFMQVFERLDQACKDRGKKVVFMAQPNKEIVYSEYMPDLTIYSEKRRCEQLFDYINENSDVIALYPLKELLAAKENYQVYYAHDTHWNTLGGFIGIQKIYEALGLETTEIADLSPIAKNRPGGDLINLGNLDPDDYPNDVDYSFTYRPEVQFTRYETTDYGVLFTEAEGATYDYTLSFIGDSFREAMKENMSKDFSKTMFLHHSCLENPEVLQTIKESDIIVIAFVERYVGSLVADAARIFSLITE